MCAVIFTVHWPKFASNASTHKCTHQRITMNTLRYLYVFYLNCIYRLFDRRKINVLHLFGFVVCALNAFDVLTITLTVVWCVQTESSLECHVKDV